MDLEAARRVLPPMWVIYDHPADYPDKFVVRVWYAEVQEPESTAHDTLEDARESIYARGGCFWLGRKPADDPMIVEVWI